MTLIRKSLHFNLKYVEQLKAEARIKYEGNFSILLRKIVEDYCEEQKRINISNRRTPTESRTEEAAER